MARRSDHNRDELYALALDAARTIVVRDGYRALTARNVAESIGYSPGTLYNLFSNLDDMILHLNASTLDALHDQLSATETTGNAERDLISMADGYLRFIDQNDKLWSLLFDHLLPEGEDLPEWYALKIERLLGLVEDALHPQFPNADEQCAQAARVLWASLHGILSLAGSGKLTIISRQPVSAMAEQLITAFIRGLEVRA